MEITIKSENATLALNISDLQVLNRDGERIVALDRIAVSEPKYRVMWAKRLLTATANWQAAHPNASEAVEREFDTSLDAWKKKAILSTPFNTDAIWLAHYYLANR